MISPIFNQASLNMSNLHSQYPNFQAFPNPSLCLHPYVPNSSELMMIRAQAIKLMQYKAICFQQKLNEMKSEVKTEFFSEKIESDVKSESDQSLFSPNQVQHTFNFESSPVQFNLRAELEKMLRFLLANMGKDNQTAIDNGRNYYINNPKLLNVYDKLTMKYFSARKCKEDIIRYILRKAFKSIRESIMKELQVCSKRATMFMCKRHFQAQAFQLLQEDGKIENEEQFFESLMPFNKNSKNKTMNIKFILEIFTSASFCQEYEKFLPEFNQIIVQEHKQKEANLVNLLVECVERNNFTKLTKLFRLPWTDVWIEDAKNIAVALMPNKRLVYNYKKSKI